MIKLKRIYDRPEITDGLRILVDRLWPRGVRRSTANVDIWIKEVGPSDDLRKWFAHEQDKFPKFKQKYLKELKQNRGFNKVLALVMANETVTLLFSASDTQHNNAVVLWSALQHALLREEKLAEKMSRMRLHAAVRHMR